MSSSFTNINAYNIKAVPEEKIIQRIDDYFYDTGYWRVPENAASDVNLYIFYKKGDPWVTIYEDVCEDLGSSELIRCAERYSHILVLPVVVASVYNSEEANFAFGDAHKPENSVLISDDSGNKKDFLGMFQLGANPFSKLEPMLKYPDDKVKLPKVWRGSYQYPEDKLSAFAQLFGMDRTLATCGYRLYDQKFKKTKSFDIDGYSITVRCYSKGTEENVRNGDITIPLMEPVKYDEAISSMKEYHAVFRNCSGSSKGVSLFVFGEAVDESVRRTGYRPAHVKAKYSTYEGETKECIQPFAIVNFANKQKGLCAKLEDVEIVKDSPVEFIFTLRDLPRSDEKIYIGISPMDNPRDGQSVIAVVNE